MIHSEVRAGCLAPCAGHHMSVVHGTNFWTQLEAWQLHKNFGCVSKAQPQGCAMPWICRYIAHGMTSILCSA